MQCGAKRLKTPLDTYIPLLYTLYVMKRTTLFLPEHYVEKLDAFCALTGLTISEVARRAFDLYLEREAPKVLTIAKALKQRKKR